MLSFLRLQVVRVVGTDNAAVNANRSTKKHLNGNTARSCVHTQWQWAILPKILFLIMNYNGKTVATAGLKKTAYIKQGVG